ncbi:SRPBCC family protein [Actinomadura sp. ATCC 31491]|uniref:SRPBCC family protein n=1 Tax=Actinomadura luzonensis TaxID=2805427 RepID=A0ABT0G177_9ACTN|nr:SRPBCC family protein [Actinomadura luzonensis]MCK2217873.1 SRPBCC family protein [Actinomadura luzonensis]
MSTIEHSVDVEVPIRVAYNQWTQFESFPEFMEGVESVKQVTDTRTHWVTEIAGVKREFDAEITEQHPDERVAWRSLDKPNQAGVVTFHRIDNDRTKVTLQMEYDPEGFVETVGDWLQIVRLRVNGDLGRFKEFIESRGAETGGWRGEVPGPHQRDDTVGTGTHEHGSTYGGAQQVPPGTIGGNDPTLPPAGGLPAPGAVPPGGPLPPPDEPPQGPRPVL